MSKLEKLAAAIEQRRQERAKLARQAANAAGLLSEVGVKHAKRLERDTAYRLRCLKAELLNELEMI